MRPSLDQMFMDMARVAARRATCNRLSVGAVLARDGRVLSTGYNGPARGEAPCYHMDDRPCEDSIHAEENALLSLGYAGGTTRGATLYTTHSPCWACAGRAINAGVAEVVFDEPFRSDSGVRRLERAGVHVRRLQ